MCLFQPTLRPLPPRLYPIAAPSRSLSLSLSLLPSVSLFRARACGSYPLVDTLSPSLFLHLPSLCRFFLRTAVPFRHTCARSFSLSRSVTLLLQQEAITPSSLKRLTRVPQRFQLADLPFRYFANFAYKRARLFD